MRKFLFLSSLALASALGLAGPASAEEDGQRIATQGNGKGATACMSCHQADGAGLEAAGFPRLAGLNPDYLAAQLEAFQTGTRKNPIMTPIAKALSGPERLSVAAYYAAQQAPYKPLSAGVAENARGKALARVGDWRQRDLPACLQCHGPNAAGVGSSFPALAGQHASYIQAQLNAWKQGDRRNDPGGLMKAVADKLDAADIRAVAAYLAALPTASAASAQSASDSQ